MSLACVANISVGFQSKKSPKNGIFEVLAARKMGREQKMREGGGAEEGRKCLQTKSRILKTAHVV